MHLRIILLAFLYFWIVQPANASSACSSLFFGSRTVSKVQKNIEFDEFFQKDFSEGGHQPGLCHENIRSFLERVRENEIQFDVKDARVLVLSRPEASPDIWFPNLVSFHHRSTKGEVGPQLLLFHVVLDYRGKIYDFSFGNEPLVLSKEDYFKRMYLESASSERRPEKSFISWEQVLREVQVEVLAVDTYLDFFINEIRALAGFPSFIWDTDGNRRDRISTLGRFLEGKDVGDQGRILPPVEFHFREQYDLPLYQSGYCNENVYFFLEGLFEKFESFAFQRASVLLLSKPRLARPESGREEDPINLVSLHERWGRLRDREGAIANLFHIVLEYQGKIYDLSFGIQPQVLSKEEYFRRMFLSKGRIQEPVVNTLIPEEKKLALESLNAKRFQTWDQVLDEMVVERIPAAFYVNSFFQQIESNIGFAPFFWDQMGHRSQRRWTLRDYLKKFGSD